MLRKVHLDEATRFRGTRRFDLRKRPQRKRMYEMLLRRGQPEELIDWIDGALLVDLWDELEIPQVVRQAWDPVVDLAGNGPIERPWYGPTRYIGTCTAESRGLSRDRDTCRGRASWHKLPTEVIIMTTRNVVLTEHQDELIASLVKEGRFQNASEVLRAGLRLVEQQEREYEAKVQALREAAQKGWDDLDAGRFDDVADEHLDDFILNLGSRSQGKTAAS